MGVWAQRFQSRQFYFVFKTNQTMRIWGEILVFLVVLISATMSQIFFFFNCSKQGEEKIFVGGILRPSGIWCFLGGEREVGPRMSRLLRPQPARAPRTQRQLHAPLETPPDAAFPARGRRQGPEPRKGTTQIAIISSLAKTSNSPNYPAREKKHKMKTN